MTEKTKSGSGSQKKEKLGSALRDNLKKRKSQARKLAYEQQDERQFVVKLRERDISRAGIMDASDRKTNKK